MVKQLEPVGPVTDTKPYVEAYVNHGRWVADCNRPYCNNAMTLTPRQTRFDCVNCRQSAPIEWPEQADAIWEALSERPVPDTRNWFPAEHRLAILAGCPHGQSVEDLLMESLEHGIKRRR